MGIPACWCLFVPFIYLTLDLSYYIITTGDNVARRFIVDKKDIRSIDEKKGIFEILSNEVKHIQVLRHNVGDEIILNEYICRILKMTKDTIILEKINYAPKVGVPNINLTLYIALLKSDKMDYIVQKAVELGVSKIVPFTSKNVVVKLDEKSKLKKVQKFNIIAKEASKQCGRSDIPQVCDVITINDLNKVIMDDKATYIFAYEKNNTSLKDTIESLKRKEISEISIIIGPEGGFDNKEADMLNKNENVKVVSLGTRILRAETAATALVSIVMYELDY